MSDDPVLSVELSRHGRALRVVVTGELDMLSERQLIEKVAKALPDLDVSGVVLDVEGVGFMDSSGLRALLVCKDSAESAGVSFALATGQSPVMRVIEAAGVTDWFAYEA